jgi:hypothetical protein
MLARGLSGRINLLAVLGLALWCLASGMRWNAVPDVVAFIFVAAVGVDVWINMTGDHGRR